MPPSSAELKRVLKRTEMNRGQTTLLKYLYEANEPVPKSAVINKIRWGDSQSFGGVLGAFSNRVNHTDEITGSPGYEAFIRRRELDGVEHFELRDEARKAIDDTPELKNAFTHPMSDLLDYEGVPIQFDTSRT